MREGVSACSSTRSERMSDKHEVGGSNPSGRTISAFVFYNGFDSAWERELALVLNSSNF